MRLKIKINSRIFFLIIINSLVWGCTTPNGNLSTDKIIYFDIDKSIENFDIGAITDSTFQIIPLETTDNSLIASIDKIEIRNDRIFIMDNLAQSVYIYEMDGKYWGKINARGQGPGEYAHLSYMTVTDSSVLVIDHLSGKQIEYRTSSLQYIREERIFDKIWCTDLFTLSGNIYYVNNWSNSNAGKFRLFSLKNNISHFNKYLPFDKEPLSLGINGPVYAVNGDEASLIYSGCDIIYRIKDGDVFPAFEVKFKDKKVVYSSGKVENVFRDNPESGRIIGINAINESDKYLFFDVSVTTEANKPMQRGNYDRYTCFYNKLKDETVIYPRLARNSLFDDEDVIVNRIIDNKLISWREAHMLLHQEKYVYAGKTFKNKAFESRLKEVLAELTDDSNHVLFIYNLK